MVTSVSKVVAYFVYFLYPVSHSLVDARWDEAVWIYIILLPKVIGDSNELKCRMFQQTVFVIVLKVMILYITANTWWFT